MYRIFICLLTIHWTFIGAVVYADSRIEMLDGSTLNGNVVSYSNGYYVIDSASLGRLGIDESTIRSIEPGGATRRGGGYSEQIRSIQQKISASPVLVEMIMGLQSDPNLQGALSDPQFVHLILSGNLQALKGDPRFLKILDNPSLQAVVDAVKTRQ